MEQFPKPQNNIIAIQPEFRYKFLIQDAKYLCMNSSVEKDFISQQCKGQMV